MTATHKKTWWCKIKKAIIFLWTIERCLKTNYFCQNVESGYFCNHLYQSFKIQIKFLIFQVTSHQFFNEILAKLGNQTLYSELSIYNKFKIVLVIIFYYKIDLTNSSFFFCFSITFLKQQLLLSLIQCT